MINEETIFKVYAIGGKAINRKELQAKIDNIEDAIIVATKLTTLILSKLSNWSPLSTFPYQL